MSIYQYQQTTRPPNRSKKIPRHSPTTQAEFCDKPQDFGVKLMKRKTGLSHLTVSNPASFRSPARADSSFLKESSVVGVFGKKAISQPGVMWGTKTRIQARQCLSRKPLFIVFFARFSVFRTPAHPSIYLSRARYVKTARMFRATIL